MYNSGFLIANVVAQNLLSTGYPQNDICTLKLDRSVTNHPCVRGDGAAQISIDAPLRHTSFIELGP